MARMSKIKQTVYIHREIAERCAEAMRERGVSFTDLILPMITDGLENLDRYSFKKKTPTGDWQKDLILKLSPFSKVQGVAFSPTALGDYRSDWPTASRKSVFELIYRITRKDSFKKRIDGRAVHLVPFTADRTTPAQELTFLHYIRAEENNGEGKFILSTDRGGAPEEPQPERPTIVYESAPSVLSYDDDEPRGGDDYGWKWS